MKLIEIINAVIAIDALKDVELDTATAYALYITKNALLPQYEFFGEEESKLINKYAKRDESGSIVSDGKTFEFASSTAAQEFIEKKRALCAMDVETNFKRCKIKLPSKIKLAHLESLKNFFDFDIPSLDEPEE